jgi:uncharacterized SAM-binding protein YcdF (DUF218 family)
MVMSFLLGLLKFALCPVALLLISSGILLMFWASSSRPAMRDCWPVDVPVPDIVNWLVGYGTRQCGIRLTCRRESGKSTVLKLWDVGCGMD